jgi:hypothetical protein
MGVGWGWVTLVYGTMGVQYMGTWSLGLVRDQKFISRLFDSNFSASLTQILVARTQIRRQVINPRHLPSNSISSIHFVPIQRLMKFVFPLSQKSWHTNILF